MNVRIVPTGLIVHKTSSRGITTCGVMHALPDDRVTMGYFGVSGALLVQDEVDCMACIAGPYVEYLKFTFEI